MSKKKKKAKKQLNEKMESLSLQNTTHKRELKGTDRKDSINIQTNEKCIEGFGTITDSDSNNVVEDIVDGAAGGPIAPVLEYIDSIEQENRCLKVSQSFFETLKQENERLKAKLKKNEQPAPESRLCAICLEKEPEITFLPCGHFVTCVNCAPCNKNCPICRKPIKGSVRTYF